MVLAIGSLCTSFFLPQFSEVTAPALQVTHVKDVLPKREEVTKRERGERGAKAEKKKKSQAGLSLGTRNTWWNLGTTKIGMIFHDHS